MWYKMRDIRLAEVEAQVIEEALNYMKQETGGEGIEIIDHILQKLEASKEDEEDDTMYCSCCNEMDDKQADTFGVCKDCM